MPRTFPKSHLAQFNLKYLQVKSNPHLGFKDRQRNCNNCIMNLSFSKAEAKLQESSVEGGGQQAVGEIDEKKSKC